MNKLINIFTIIMFSLFLTVVFPIKSKADIENKNPLAGKKISKMYVDSQSGGVITDEGELYIWGGILDKEIGKEGLSYKYPVKVLDDVIDVKCSTFTWGAITSSGDLYTWGIHNGSDGTRNRVSEPERIMSDVKSFYTSGAIEAVIKNNGDLYLWGSNFRGIVNDSFEDCYSPTLIMQNVKNVYLNDSTIGVITTENDLYVWGYNDFGTVGNGTRDKYVTSPQLIMKDVLSYSAEDDTSVAVDKNGDLYIWGKHFDGGLRGGSNCDSTEPVLKAQNVKCANSYSSYLTKNGDVYNCVNGRSYTPTKTLSSVRDFFGAYHMTCAINDNDEFYVWGNINAQSVPTMLIDDVKEFCAQKSYGPPYSPVAVLTNTGDMYVWNCEFLGEKRTEPYQVNSEYLEDVTVTSCDDVFYYASGSENDYTAKFHYRDEYFYDTAYNYNSSLATMSMCMAFSAFGSNRTDDYNYKSQNLKDLLKKCGFLEEKFSTNEYYTVKPQTDSVGVGIGRKHITDNDGNVYTLIAIGVRGGGYESEWASNFTLGESGTHKGFTQARDEVLRYLKQYISDNNDDIEENIKIWIAGYSRAAATTNLVAASLDNGYLEDLGISIKPDDIYAFCFECPQGALKSDATSNTNKYKFRNITCIINPVDVVTKVAPTEPASGFSFFRYGRQKYLPTSLTEGVTDYNYYKGKMLEYYNEMLSTDGYIVDDFQMKKVLVNGILWEKNSKGDINLKWDVNDYDSKWDQEAFLDSSLFYLFSSIKNRKNYVQTYENDIREICSVVFGLDDNKKQLFNSELYKLLNKDNPKIMACIITGHEDILITILTDDIISSMKTVGITNYSNEKVKSAGKKIASLLLRFGLSHPNYTSTMISNIKGVGAAHYPELCLAWLMSFDSNYGFGNTNHFGTGSYRVLKINCPVDIDVKDTLGDSLATITNDKVIDDNNKVVCFVDDSGQKIVYLPMDSKYYIGILPTADGVMDYSICEYSEDFGGFNRVVNYYNVPLKKGEQYESTIPSASTNSLDNLWKTGSDADYELLDSNGDEIKVDFNAKGNSIEKQIYSVEVETNNSLYGSVSGDNLLLVGGYAQVNAVPNDGYEFLGWFENETKISSELTYRFLVLKDTNLMAKFGTSNEKQNDEKQNDDSNSVIKNADSVQMDGAGNTVLQGNANTSVQNEEVSPTIAPEKIIIKKIKNTAKKTITIKYKNIKARGYQIQIASNKKFKKGKKNKYTTKTTVKIKKLKKGKTYYIRVRAYNMNGTKKLYGKWSKAKKIKIKK